MICSIDTSVRRRRCRRTSSSGAGDCRFEEVALSASPFKLGIAGESVPFLKRLSKERVMYVNVCSELNMLR
jgi:hypothetical protein